MLKCKKGHEQEDGKFCQECGGKLGREGVGGAKEVIVYLHGDGPAHGEVEEQYADDDLSNPQLERLWEFLKYTEVGLRVWVTDDEKAVVVGLAAVPPPAEGGSRS